ncbi:hypothetical protein AWM70_20965 [Paenibacillus yonginensis]|uniref:Uncharacterized protein n=1 Tax=Paenibacillus yonginensis TaxID=1462996 RepID=A0A1B1N5Q5_9BACL|nr:hypothetical protein [Paenibacillus yonginensis]ANS76749.1 hypothetical protein AWM70_20965 [Paenibacillus yonginensis]
MYYDDDGSYLEALPDKLKNSKLPKGITWFEDHVHFDTLREASEWVLSDSYNKIGHDYNGYISTDPKLVHALVYELVRHRRYEGKVRVWEYGLNGKYYHLLWIEQ